MADSSHTPIELPFLKITPEPAPNLGLGEAWQSRELLYFLLWRDMKVRYKQTLLGVLWAALQPIGMMVVFTIFLGRLAKVPSNGIPYPLFVLAALLPWQLFAHALTESSVSLVSNERLITKIYFPRLIIPAASVASALPDFAISFVVMMAVLLFYGFIPSLTLLAAPLFVLMGILAAFGVSLWLSALNVQYRDVRHVIGFLTQLWLFVTPVVYPATVIALRWRTLYALNPMAGIVEGFRWSVTGVGEFPLRLIIISAIVIAISARLSRCAMGCPATCGL